MGGNSVLKRVKERALGRKAIAAWAAIALALTMVPVAGIALPAAASDGDDGPRDRFVVVLRDSSSARQVAAEHSRRHGADVDLVYQHALSGYAARLPAQAIEGISRDPRVAYIEADAIVEATSHTTPTGVSRIAAPANTTLDIDDTDDVRVDVDIAILDTGLDSDHPDLNVASMTDCTLVASLESPCSAGAGEDEHGHGTHVAGTAAALDDGTGVVGVAPGARLHGVKVLSRVGTGLMSWVIAGIDWTTANADSIEVANMSLGCDCPSAALDEAIARSVDGGIVYVTSAGNNARDASHYSPANHPDVITVSALADYDGVPGGNGTAGSCGTDGDDTLAKYSNWGATIEVAAPGDCILSTAPAGRYRTMSGTSMAAPHVAGAAAILASGANAPRDRADVETIRGMITGAGTFDWVDDSGDGSQEPLLNVGSSDVFRANSDQRTLGSVPTPTPTPSPSESNESPVAAFTYSCSDLTCTFAATSSSDPDGTISSYAWSLGDGTTATGSAVEKTYTSAGTYTVRLDVTDDDGATSSSSQTIEVNEAAPPAEEEQSITLTAAGTRVSGNVTVELRWSGTDETGNVLVYRNGAIVATTSDDGAYIDTFDGSSGSVTYRICEEGTTRCSNEVTLFA